ncbi:hypothetical protein RclHR1_27600002 [Rhizophagus clarus]|uniref:Integrase catalytic domain-containing protein n=1 Tax=Rhizophagus clarus TaxID=94130 RepID=A0A2Z6R233_9GLOM|nr:hypothetical protein RclHR1_27600002 [Rhizophagus clarus]GET01050.1 hypothetical protein RCL_e12160_RclHR1_27600002 [Rhizophagus clarus]
MPRPRYIPCASFTSITTPNEVHQADVLYMPYDKVGRITYLFCLNVVDVASRYKASIPIGAYSVKDREGILTSKTIARALEKIYDDPEIPLVWPKLLITDKGPEFRGDCEKLMREHGVKIQKAKSKRTMGIVERYNQTLAKRLFRIQDAHDLLTLHLSERSRSWVQNLPIIVKDINISITNLISMSPAKAIKKKQVKAKPSWPARRSIGYDEAILPSYTEVRYLFEPSDLEGGKKRATDCNWSPEVFIIESYLLKENQPVLYKLYNGPERSFVREELQIVKDAQLPPQWILKH